MKSIKKYIELLDEEIEGAQDYAEKYVECRVKGNITRANRFKEMASDELKHCGYIHEMAVQEIEEIKKVYTAPSEMQEKWDKAHKEYVEKVAWIKQMLTL
jgi:chromosome segregation ATPase